ncbi:hypothetical protein YC2023_041892 [Brassica napus]
MPLKIVKKATSQREDLALYFGFCKEFGVSNAHDILIFVRISEKDIEAIEKQAQFVLLFSIVNEQRSRNLRSLRIGWYNSTLEFVKGLRSDKAIHTFGKYATHADQLNKEYTRDRLKKHYLNKETIQ